MFDTTKPRAPAGSASAFLVPTEPQGSGSNIWAEAGRAIEQAYCDPVPMRQTVRIAVVLALVVAAKLCAAGVFG